MTGEELYLEGCERMHKFYETAPYGGGGGMHSTDYHKMIVEQYYIPAAEKGCVLAVKECGDYYSMIDRGKAIGYYRQYLKLCPDDTVEKMMLVARFGLRVLL